MWNRIIRFVRWFLDRCETCGGKFIVSGCGTGDSRCYRYCPKCYNKG